MKNQEFITAVEKLVDPIEGGAMHVIQQYNQLLPVELQHKLIKSSANKNPYMGFIVEPYALFTCFKIVDLDYFEQQLHDNFKLIKTRVFDHDVPEYYLIVSSFNVRTSAFFGNRIEAYVICEDTNTGMLTWVIVDILSNSISYEQRFGLVPANAQVAVTTGFDGSIFVDAAREQTSFSASCFATGTVRTLDPRLWIEGNLSVGYGKQLSTNGDVFSLLFDVREVATAVEVSDCLVEINNWFEGAIAKQSNVSLYFPYAQHFISSSPGSENAVSSQAEMEQIISEIDFDNLKVYSSKQMFKLQQGTMAIMFILIILLILIILI